MAHKILTDAVIRNEKPSSGKRYDVHDLRMPGLALRVGPRVKTLVFIGRLPGKSNPTRWTIAVYPADEPLEIRETALADAREKAQLWAEQVRRGIDPLKAALEEKMRSELVLRRTFGSALADWMATLPSRKRNRNVEKDLHLLTRELLDPGRNAAVDKPMSEITDEDAKEIIEAIRIRPAPTTALACYKHLKKFFKWVRMGKKRREHYGCATNPMADLTLDELQLGTNLRQRYLKPKEIRALWRVIDKLDYPFGPFCKMLLLTAQRKSDVAGARWSEIDFDERLWIIPERRYKTGVEQIVPLSKPVFHLLSDIRSSLPAGHGDLIFSHTNGVTRINGFSKALDGLRKKVQAQFAAENPNADLEHWTLHDKRRTAKTQMAKLQIEPHISEAVLGHGKRGMEKVYNQYSYQPQMRSALEKWADFVLALVANDTIGISNQKMLLTLETRDAS